MPFLQTACDEKKWDLAEKICLWQIALAQVAQRSTWGKPAQVLLRESDDLSAYYHNAGQVARERGDPFTAKEYFKKALAPTYASKSRVRTHSQVRAAIDLAKIAKEENDPSTAGDLSGKAWDFLSGQPEMLITQGNDALHLLAWAHLARGEYAGALRAATTLVDFLNQARWQKTLAMARALGQLGSVQYFLGDPAPARGNLTAALELYRQEPDQDVEGQAEILLKRVALQGEGEKPEKKFLEHAKKLAPSLPDLLKAKLYLMLGEACAQPPRASENYYQSALHFATEAGKNAQNDPLELDLLQGDLLLRLGRAQQASPLLADAFWQYFLRQELAGTSRSAYLLQKAHAALGQRRGAIFWGKLGINALQRIRADLRGLPAETQRSYVTTQQHIFQDLIDLLQQEGRVLEAENIYSLLKKEEVRQFAPEETLFRHDGPTAPMVGVENALYGLLRDTVSTLDGIRKAVSMAEHWDGQAPHLPDWKPTRLRLAGLVKFDDKGDPIYLEPKNQELMRRMLKSQGCAVPFVRQYPEDIGMTPHDLPALKKRFAEEREIFHAFLRALPAALAGEWEPVAQRHLQAAARNLGPGTALLHAVTGNDALWLWLTGADGKMLKVRKIPVPRRELHRHVRELRDIITQRLADPRPKCKELYDLLIGPMEPDLEELKPATLLFSLDNILRYIPPAILHDGKEWLIEKYAVGVFLEASRDTLEPKKTGGRIMGALGLTEPKEGFPALPGVEAELERIVRTDDTPAGIVPGRIYLNDAFTEASLASVLRGDTSLLHVATHFRLDPKSARESFLLLGDGTRLPLSRLAEKQFDFKNLQQIVLSACETGLRLDGSGSEIESLGALVQEKGAQSVLATLWPIADQATSVLMPLFYQNLMQGRSRAEALRQAQLSLIRGDWAERLPELRGAGYPRLRRQDLPGRSHPFYWGAFILMGDWR